MKATRGHYKLVGIIAGFSLLLTLPMALESNYHLHLVIMVCINTILASSLNLVLGYAGNASLCHGALYGIGAYTAALVSTNLGLSPWAGIITAGSVAGLLALPVGLASLPFRGVYFAVATLGFQQIINLVTVNWDKLTRGPMGITNVPPFLLGALPLGMKGLATMSMILAGSCIFSCWLIVRSRIGTELRAIRDNEIAARSVGINSFRVKNLIFCISAAMAGIAGSIFAHYTGFVSPDSFTVNVSVTSVIMVLAGGIGTLWGGALGALLLTLLPEMMRFLQDYRMVLYGLALVALIIYLPNGIIGLLPYRNGIWGNSSRKEEEGA